MVFDYWLLLRMKFLDSDVCLLTFICLKQIEKTTIQVSEFVVLLVAVAPQV